MFVRAVQPAVLKSYNEGGELFFVEATRSTPQQPGDAHAPENDRCVAVQDWDRHHRVDHAVDPNLQGLPVVGVDVSLSGG